MTYADTGFLCSLYAPDAHTPRVLSRMKRQPLPLARLSASHSATLGTRTLDILHVAAALVLGLADLLTFDTRQAALAKAAGLKVPRL